MRVHEHLLRVDDFTAMMVRVLPGRELEGERFARRLVDQGTELDCSCRGAAALCHAALFGAGSA